MMWCFEFSANLSGEPYHRIRGKWHLTRSGSKVGLIRVRCSSEEGVGGIHESLLGVVLVHLHLTDMRITPLRTVLEHLKLNNRTSQGCAIMTS